MKIGTTDIDKCYVGTTEIEKIYLGTTSVYEKSVPAIQKTYSGFSDTNYIRINSNPFDPVVNTLTSFEIHTAVTLDSIATQNDVIMGVNQSGTAGWQFRLTTNSSNLPLFRWSHYVDGSENAIAGHVQFVAGQKMFIKITYTDKYRIFTSSDDENWDSGDVGSANERMGISNTNSIVIGFNPALNGYYLRGSLDFGNTYIKIDGTKIFDGSTAIQGTDYTIFGTLIES